MKALLVHAGDEGYGGGEVQMNRLIGALRGRGLDARAICRRKTRQDSLELPRSDGVERLLGAITRRCGLGDIHRVSSFKLSSMDEFTSADVVDFHCTHHGVFNYLALPSVTAVKPAVFTLHDMWPFTGHCHNSLECDRWRRGCGRCPHLDVAPVVQRDATAVEWRLKQWAYRRSRLALVAPSRWLMRLAQQSLLADFPIHHVPHGIDTSTYRPLDPSLARAAFALPSTKKVVLGVAESFSRRLKGGDLLVEALRRLPPSLKSELVLLLLGSAPEAVARHVEIPVVSVGFVASDQLKALAYSAADVFVHPTRADNFPVVLLESLACGTPVASFAVGGVPEMVRPGITGSLSNPEDAAGLGRSIAEMLADAKGLDRMRGACRETALAEYSLDLQAQRYIDVYRTAIARPQVAAGLAAPAAGNEMRVG